MRSIPLSKVATPVGAVVLVLAVPQAGMAEQPSPDATPPERSGQVGAAPEDLSAESANGIWVVQLEEPALAWYSGGVRGLEATSPEVTSDAKLDVTAPASAAYVDYLADQQAEVASRMNTTLDRTVEVVHEYRNVFNGLAVRVDAAEAAKLARLPGVAAVVPDEELELDTDVSHELIESAAVWDGETSDGVGTRGEGVIVGMLDTGVNPHHPSFAAVDGDGYQHTNPFGEGVYVGVCDPDHPAHQDICNDKLIGVWDIIGDIFSGPVDTVGHGSHVGSTTRTR